MKAELAVPLQLAEVLASKPEKSKSQLCSCLWYFPCPLFLEIPVEETTAPRRNNLSLGKVNGRNDTLAEARESPSYMAKSFLLFPSPWWKIQTENKTANLCFRHDSAIVTLSL